MPSPSPAGRNTRLLAAVFCPGCGVSYVPGPPEESCPHCQTPASQGHAVDCDEAMSVPESTTLHGPRASLASECDQLIGHRLGVYQIEGLLGAGAMGRVYLARHLDLQRSCAVKILPPRLAASDPAYVDRFMNEGRAQASLIHPNIVTVHAIGAEDGYYFLEMEFVPGLSLGHMVLEEGAQSPARATTLALRVAEGLSAAHVAGVIHRDLKPDNVLLTHTGIPKLGDFGLSKRFVVEDSAGQAEFAGTPPYMAPELFHGAPPSPASDVYALGVSYFQLLTGRLPYEADDLAKLRQLVGTSPIPSVRSRGQRVPMEMVECLHLMLAKAPEARPANAMAAAILLQAVLGESEDIESLLTRAFRDHREVTWLREGARYRLQVRFASGRSQVAFIEPSHHAAAERLLMISSVCCPAAPSYFETALRLNSEILHGGLAIREIDGRSVFVMMDNYPWSTVDPEEIRRSVLEVAHHADAIEKLLTGEDRH